MPNWRTCEACGSQNTTGSHPAANPLRDMEAVARELMNLKIHA